MKSDITLSVIVPVYNVSPYLHDCFDSLLYSIASDTEIIVVDDGSTDESLQICEEYAAKYSQMQVLSQPNHGQSSARNAGLKIARGKYLTFVDSDDFVSMPAINRVVEKMETEDADLAIADFLPVYSHTKFVAEETACGDFEAQRIAIADYLKEIQRFNMMVWNKIYRRSVVEDILYPVGAIYEDVFYLHHVLQRVKKIIYTPVNTYYYRLQREGSTVCSFKSNRLRGYPFFEEFGEYVKQNFGVEEYQSVATYIADFFASQYYECRILGGDKRILADVLSIYRKYVQATPFRWFPLFRSLFRISPRLYTFIRSKRHNRA